MWSIECNRENEFTSTNENPNIWKLVKNLIEPGRGGNKGGVSTYSNYINKWTGSKLGIHQIIRGGKYIHGPHFHPWILGG